MTYRNHYRYRPSTLRRAPWTIRYLPALFALIAIVFAVFFAVGLAVTSQHY